MHSHHCNSQDPSPLTTIASDRVEKQKTEQTTSELGTTPRSTIPRTCTQAWLNFTRRCCWRFVSISWCVSRMGIQEGRSRIVRPLLISLVPLMFPHVKNLLRVWGRVLFGFPMDTAIFEKTFCNTFLAVERLFWTFLNSICRRQSDSRSTFLMFVGWLVMIRC